MDIITKYNTRASMAECDKVAAILDGRNWHLRWPPLNKTINFESLTKALSFVGQSNQTLVEIKPVQNDVV